jgi:hypothetical protein
MRKTKERQNLLKNLRSDSMKDMIIPFILGIVFVIGLVMWLSYGRSW